MAAVSYSPRVALVLLLLYALTGYSQYIEIPHQEVENWAWKFGRHLYELSKKVTSLDEIAQSYAPAKVKEVKGADVLREMKADIEMFLSWKIQAVQRITETAEQLMLGHEKQTIDLSEVTYFNAKEINKDKVDLKLTENEHFNRIPVNTEHSTVHVATSVYDKAPDVLKAIQWSSFLNPTFSSNYQQDPSLSWQYFGSSLGFLRQFPGVKWKMDEDEADIYDCRMRPWYIEAAASPKDIVVLMDNSGSMMGLRKEIAKHVAFNILETLNHNDFVAVLNVTNRIENVVSSFWDTLVPATRENVEVIKETLEEMKTENVSNYVAALTTAFELLQKYNKTGLGSQCNQAIMIISDGVPDDYVDIFKEHNWPDKRVRIFTYLIGREVTDVREVKWMACANKGYFTHIKTLAEVREQVEKYIPVMSRPMVLQKKPGEMNLIWTPVYADIADPKQSKWLFEMRERAKKRIRILNKAQEFSSQGLYVNYDEESDDQDAAEASSQEEGVHAAPAQEHNDATWQEEEWVHNEHQLMTTVASPVFNRNKTDNKYLLLGVAGTDVPVKEIIKLAPPYKLGVNGYPFIITNNGHLLYHPDLRPMYQGLLKMDYSSIDLSEVELSNSSLNPWDSDDEVMQDSMPDYDMKLRTAMIDRKVGMVNMTVKLHLDNMKRVTTRMNRYYYTALDKTPFSLGIALPDGYGMYRVHAETDVKSASFNVVQEFEGTKWRVHPDWVYCRFRFPMEHKPRSPQESLLEFLRDIQTNKRKLKEKFERVRPPPTKEKYKKQNLNNRDKTEYYSGETLKTEDTTFVCDRELVQSLIFDAKATSVFGKKHSIPVDTRGNNNGAFARKNGVSISFVATRSGLTRWEDLLPEEELGNATKPHFIDLHNRATDELWYRRAIDQYYINSTSFVFSVPFDAARKNNTYVTASHAIFVESGNIASPAAVVGLQFKHSVFAETFFNITSNCQFKSCNTNCSSEELDCFLLDDNGFVIVSEKYENTGKFFGEVDGLIMHSLIVDGVYQGIQMYDYQAICEDMIYHSSTASYLTMPIQQLQTTLKWLWGKMFLLFLQYSAYSWWNEEWAYAAPTNPDEENSLNQYIDREEMGKKKRRMCTTNFTLYRLNPAQLKMKPIKAKLTKCNPNGCDRPFSVQQVPYTNLVLLAVDATCPCESSQTTSITPQEVKYANVTRYQMMRTHYYRRRPPACYSSHPDEVFIKDCGRGCNLKISVVLLIVAALLSLQSRS